MSATMERLISKAKETERHVVLPEGDDERTIIAASDLVRDGICEVTVLGNKEKTLELAKKTEKDLSGVNIVDPADNEWSEEMAELLFERRKHKGITIEQARDISKQNLYFANLMLKAGKCDGCVAGAA